MTIVLILVIIGVAVLIALACVIGFICGISQQNKYVRPVELSTPPETSSAEAQNRRRFDFDAARPPQDQKKIRQRTVAVTKPAFPPMVPPRMHDDSPLLDYLTPSVAGLVEAMQRNQQQEEREREVLNTPAYQHEKSDTRQSRFSTNTGSPDSNTEQRINRAVDKKFG